MRPIPFHSLACLHGVSLYQKAADMAAMKACLSIPDVLSRRDGVLAPSCEFDCNLDCEGSKGSLNGGGRMERVSSSSWEDIGDCCRDACCVPGGKEGSPRPRATASPSSGAPSVMSALLLVPVRNSSSPPSFSAKISLTRSHSGQS